MSQLRFDHFSQIINVVLLLLLLKSLFQSLPQQHELALTTTPDGKSTVHHSPPLPSSVCLIIHLSNTFSLFFCEL